MSEQLKPTYPQHEKLAKISDQSQAVGEFLSAMRERGLWLCEFIEGGTNGQLRYVDATGRPTQVSHPDINPDYMSWGDGWQPAQLCSHELLAQFFEIDLAALEQEKRQMLAIARGDQSC